MKEIPLSQGKVALVDDNDFTWLSQWNWYAWKNQQGDFYAVRHSPSISGKYYTIYMHRQILGLQYGDPRVGDHRNHNTLDNRRDNIRICTNQQNNMNMKSNRNTSSKYKGVCWHKHLKKWQAYIQINKKLKYLGYFEKEEDAALAYDKAAIKYFGEFAHLNFFLELV